jgi:NAD(P)-dependent dehydrogenase (short-subunit alcohol dehydrogenase family)
MENSSFLKGKVALVTGSAKNLGRALALSLAKEGAIVAAHYHESEKEAKTLREELRRHNEKSEIFRADLRNEKETREMISAVEKTYGRVDVLINNVGNFIYKPFDEVEYEEFKDVIETNLYASFLCTKLVIEGMKARGEGNVINLGCAGADRLTVRELTTPYYIAKTGVILLTKIFARTYAPHGVRFNSISPGVLESSVAEPLSIPAGRRASFDDIVNTILFLLSPDSSYINGANIEVAGGWVP